MAGSADATPIDAITEQKLSVIRTSPEQSEGMTSLGSSAVFCHRCLVLGDVSHFDVLASALGEACPISLDPVPVHEPVHEIEQAANRDSGMQGRLVPPRREDRVGIGMRHACRRLRQLLHESENRPQLAVDGSGREILDQAVDRLRRPNNSAAARWPP